MLLRNKLIWALTLMAMAPLLVLLFFVVDRVEEDIARRTAREVQQTLEKMAKEIRTEMHNQRSITSGLAKVPVVRKFAEVTERDPENEYDRRANALAAFFLNYQSTVPSIQAIRFTDTKGRTLVKTKEGKLVTVKYKTRGGRQFVENLSSKRFFTRAIKSKYPVSISSFERGKVSTEVAFCPAMVRYSVPIRDDLDVLLGILTINMWGKRVDDAVEAALGGIPGSAYIVEVNKNAERDGIYLYHKNADMRFANQTGAKHRFTREITKAQWNGIRAGAESGHFAGTNGKMIYYRKYFPYPERSAYWLLVIDLPIATVLKPVARLRNSISIMIVIGLVLSYLIAYWTAKRLVRPVQQLAQLMKRYADGAKEVRYPEGRNDEIENVGKAFNYMSDHLEQARQERETAEAVVRQSERLAAIGQMAAGIGHEINNPLMNINSLASLLEKSIPADDVQAKNDLETMQKEVKRCSRIVQGILNFARESEPELTDFDLSRLVLETRDLFKVRLNKEDIRLITELEPGVTVYGDRKQVQQVMVNLLLNSIQASQPRTEISIRLDTDSTKAILTILDEGKGIPEEMIGKVFDPFFTTKSEGQGTGLGLSISYGIVDKHHGTLRIGNRPTGGVQTVVELPLSSGNRESVIDPGIEPDTRTDS